MRKVPAPRVQGRNLLASKKKLQRQFVAGAAAENLSPKAIVERASVFPMHGDGKVISWPKF